MRKELLLTMVFLLVLMSGCAVKKDDGIACRIICKLDDDFALGADDEDLVITDGDDEEDITFVLHQVEDGYYYIEHEDTGLVLGTEDESEEVHAKVTLVEYDEDDTQLWQISETDDDYYYIINKESELFLDINGAQIFDGNTLQIYTRNDAFNAQSFLFVDVDDEDEEFEPDTLALEENGSANLEEVLSELPEGPLEITEELISLDEYITDSGMYRIACKLDGSFSIGFESGNPNKAVLTNSDDSGIYAFRIVEVEENTYCIMHDETEYVLELQDDSVENHTRVCLAEFDCGKNQYWYAAHAPEDGYFYLISASSGRYLDVTNMSVQDGNWLQVYQPGISDAQSWRFEEVVSE